MMKATDYNYREGKPIPGNLYLFSGCTTIFLLFSLATSGQAVTEFQGTLNTVSITDATGTNAPPLASFTYSREGDNIIFDASGSSDPDGTISHYKWNFDDTEIAVGQSATYTQQAAQPLRVTLTVKDNNNGVSIVQDTIASTSSVIYDDFSSDTSPYYSEVSSGSGTVNTASGVYSATKRYEYSTWMSNTPLSSVNSYVEAVGRFNSTGRIAVAIQSDAAAMTGYYVYLNETGVVVKNCKNINFSNYCQFVSQSRNTWTTGIDHTLRVELSGDNLTVYVDSIPSHTTNLPTSYSNTQVGVGVYAGSKTTETYITSFSADIL